MREDMDEEDRDSSIWGVWTEPDIAINERAARDTERRLAQRAQQLGQRQEGNAVSQHNASESTEPELGITRLDEAASETNDRDTDNATQGSSASLDMEGER